MAMMWPRSKSAASVLVSMFSPAGSPDDGQGNAVLYEYLVETFGTFCGVLSGLLGAPFILGYFRVDWFRYRGLLLKKPHLLPLPSAVSQLVCYKLLALGYSLERLLKVIVEFLSVCPAGFHLCYLTGMCGFKFQVQVTDYPSLGKDNNARKAVLEDYWGGAVHVTSFSSYTP